MKRTPLLIALGIFLAIAAAIFIYDFKLDHKRSTWDFIGPNTILVYQPPPMSNDIIKKAFDDIIKDFPALQDSTSLNLSHNLLAGKDILASLSIISKDNFDFAFYIPLSSSKEKKDFSDFQQLLISKKVQQRQRTFEGVIIYELESLSKKTFSFAVVDEILIASSTSFLVEDAVRISVLEDAPTFKKNNYQLFQLSTLNKDDGDLYINLPEFFRWMKSFADKDLLNQDLAFGKSLLTDLKINDENIAFNGFATDSLERGKSFLSLFNKQNPVEFEMKSIISTNSAAVLHYGISNPESWFNERNLYLKNRKSSIKDSIEKLNKYKFSASEFYKNVDNEIGLCILNNRSSDGSVLMVELKNSTTGISSLDKLADAISSEARDSIYSEQYSDYEIRKIGLSNFTYSLFWPLASKSTETYFTLVDKYVLFSESDELLKEFLDDIDEENTWAKSLRWNTFLQTSLQESNVDLIFDMNLLSNYLDSRLTPRWKSYFESTHFLNIEQGSIQFSKLEHDYYFAANFPLKGSEISTKSTRPFSNVRFQNTLVSKPFLVKNHDTGSTELIVQDTLNEIYLIGLNGKIEWKLNLDDKLTDDIKQIDYYKNGKLQYLFLTKSKVHIIDRLGRYIAGYPKSINSRNLEYSTVVDYDKSRNYRFMISDKEKKIFILDKEGNLLDGWSPKLLKKNLFATARHYRILGRDYFVAIQDDGLVYVMNRRGEIDKNFPLALNTRPSGDYFFEAGKNFASSTFTIVSQAGLKVRFNLLGRILSEESLLKTNVNSHFYLLSSGKTSAFVRIDNSKLAAFDQQGKLLFEKENAGSESLEPHLFDFDSGKRIFSFTDAAQGLSYIIDDHGNSILQAPIETTHTPAITYNQRKGELMIFWTNGDSMTQTSFHWPE